jgi:predicted lysophospholipase L1 biosynthesis ABC-type transport system permease subunit
VNLWSYIAIIELWHASPLYMWADKAAAIVMSVAVVVGCLAAIHSTVNNFGLFRDDRFRKRKEIRNYLAVMFLGSLILLAGGLTLVLGLFLLLFAIAILAVAIYCGEIMVRKAISWLVATSEWWRKLFIILGPEKP